MINTSTPSTVKKIMPLIAASAIQICLGVAYIWSVFQTGIADSIFGGDNALAGLSFSILLACLSIGGLIGGKIAQRFSTRIAIISGGILLSIGFLLAGFTSPKAPWTIWITYGLIGGIGMGFTYTTSIACAQRWFPHKKGLVTGVIVAALGFGGVIFTPIVEALIKAFGGTGVGELKTLMVLSAIFLVVCSIGGYFMVNPPKEYTDKMTSNAPKSVNVSSVSLSPTQVLRKVDFYIITVIMLLACMSGLMMIGFAKPIASGKGMTEIATVGVLLISVFNSIGRLFWGYISDKIGRNLTIVILLVGSTIMSLLVAVASGYWIFVIISAIGFFYGGILGTFPALTAEMFGAKHVAINYSLVLLGFGAGAIISSYIAGYYKNLAVTDISKMNPAFYIAAACCAVSLLLLLLLILKNKANKKTSDIVEVTETAADTTSITAAIE